MVFPLFEYLYTYQLKYIDTYFLESCTLVSVVVKAADMQWLFYLADSIVSILLLQIHFVFHIQSVLIVSDLSNTPTSVDQYLKTLFWCDPLKNRVIVTQKSTFWTFFQIEPPAPLMKENDKVHFGNTVFFIVFNKFFLSMKL